MMLDDDLRLCSSDDVDGVGGGASLKLGTTLDLGAKLGSATLSADPTGGQDFGCLIRVTETFNDAAAATVYGFSVNAHLADTAASAIATTAVTIGQSQIMGGTTASATWVRAHPTAGEDIFFRLNPTMMRTALSDTNPLTGENLYAPNTFPRYLSLVFWSAGIPSYTFISGAMIAGKVDAWLTDQVPTIARSAVDFSDYN